MSSNLVGVTGIVEPLSPNLGIYFNILYLTSREQASTMVVNGKRLRKTMEEVNGF